MADIIYRGTLSLKKLQELADIHLPKPPAPEVTAPVAVAPVLTIDENTYHIRRDEDGNYTGITRKFGNLIEVRDIGPDYVLMRLIAHSGK